MYFTIDPINLHPVFNILILFTVDESKVGGVIKHVRYLMSVSPLNGDFHPGQDDNSHVYVFKNGKCSLICHFLPSSKTPGRGSTYLELETIIVS